MIKIEHLRKEYPNVTPIKDVNCIINKGDVIAVIGPSGTGKSTFINCINRLENPTSGSIWYGDTCITDNATDINKVRQHIGMVFQSFNLFGHLTILENAMLAPINLLNMPKQEAFDKVMALLETVGLKDKANSYPYELSGGQQQRAAIVRTLAMDPEVILFDEPTSALDPTMVGEVLSVIKDLASKGLTMIIVTHEMNFAKNVSNRVFYMDEGIIYEDGTPDQIFNNPQKEKTREFINRLKKFEYVISSNSFDFKSMNTEIEEFCLKHLINHKQKDKMLVIAEELCVQSVLKYFKDNEDINIVLSFEYSEKTESISAQIKMNKQDFTKEMIEPISMDIINNVATDLEIKSDSEKSEITLNII